VRHYFLFIILLFSVPILGDEKDKEAIILKWKFEKDSRFEYSLSGTVSESKGGKHIESRIRGAVIVTGINDEEAVFLRRYDELRWREEGTSYYSPGDELEKFTLTYNFGSDGKVKTEISKDKLQDLLTSLMPLPSNPVRLGDVWRVGLETMGLVGSCELARWDEKAGQRCATLILRASRVPEGEEEPDKEIETKARFDVNEGCFVSVERRIKEKGDTSREELLTLVLESSPSRPSKARLMEKMVDELRSRLALTPGDVELRKRLLNILMGMGRYEEVLKEVESAVAEKPLAEFYVIGGDSAFALGDYERALKLYEEALKRDKKSKMALLGAAKASFLLNRYKETIEYAKLSFEGGKGPYQSLYYIGAALAKLGNFDEAQEVLRRYIEKSPDFDPNKKPIIAFSKEGDVKILAEPKVSDDLSKKSRYSENELELGRQILAVVVKEESVRMKLTPEEVEKMLDYLASLYGKTTEKMISDFLSDRTQTFERLKSVLNEKIRIPEEKIEALDFKDYDVDFCTAALSFLTKTDILKRYERLKSDNPGVTSVYLSLLKLYISNPAKFEKEITSTIHILKTIEPENSFYPLIEAWLWFRLKRQKSALRRIEDSAMCNSFTTHLLEEARKRCEVLKKINYPEELIDVTAWTAGDRKLERLVKESLDATLFLAKKFLEDGEIQRAKEISLLVHRISVVIEARAESALLHCSAIGLQEAALLLLFQVAKKSNDEERSKHFEDLLSSAKERSIKLLDKYQEFLFDSEKAFTVWWITDPKKCSTFLQELFKIGERELMLREKELGGK
jgi:tetratricopeptide (TPR) repeat protein